MIHFDMSTVLLFVNSAGIVGIIYLPLLEAELVRLSVQYIHSSANSYIVGE